MAHRLEPISILHVHYISLYYSFQTVLSRKFTEFFFIARLAQEASVSPTTISGIETGKIERPHFGTLGKLARALSIAPEELLDLHGALE
jgi:transcriptional regulator with XRE-family HTH domain